MPVSNQYIERVAIAAGIAGLGIALLVATWYASNALLVIFAGLLFSVLLRGLASILSERTGLDETWSLWIVVVVLFGALGAAVWIFSATVVEQFDELGQSLASIWDQIHAHLKRYSWGREILSTLGERGDEEKANVIGRAIAAVLGGISGLVVSILIGLYVAANPTLYRHGLLRLVPLRHRAEASAILDELRDTLRHWLVGTLTIMVVVGVLTTTGLWLLEVPHALALGIIAFLLEFVPYIGPILAAIPAVLTASTVGAREALSVVVLYWAIQSFEGYLLSPLVYQKSINIPPLITIGAQVVLGTIIGVLGVIFATPLTACAWVLVQRLYVEGALGDRLDRPLERFSSRGAGKRG